MPHMDRISHSFNAIVYIWIVYSGSKWKASSARWQTQLGLTFHVFQEFLYAMSITSLRIPKFCFLTQFHVFLTMNL